MTHDEHAARAMQQLAAPSYEAQLARQARALAHKIEALTAHADFRLEDDVALSPDLARRIASVLESLAELPPEGAR